MNWQQITKQQEHLTLSKIRSLITQKDPQTGQNILLSVRAYSYDENRNTAGECIEIEHCIFYSQSYEIIRFQICMRDEITKKIVPTSQIRAVHLSLITRINNIEVQWS